MRAESLLISEEQGDCLAVFQVDRVVIALMFFIGAGTHQGFKHLAVADDQDLFLTQVLLYLRFQKTCYVVSPVEHFLVGLNSVVLEETINHVFLRICECLPHLGDEIFTCHYV